MIKQSCPCKGAQVSAKFQKKTCPATAIQFVSANNRTCTRNKTVVSTCPTTTTVACPPTVTACKPSTVSTCQGETIHYGEKVRIGDGFARTFVLLGRTTEGVYGVRRLGISVDASVFTSLPSVQESTCVDIFRVQLSVPCEALEAVENLGIKSVFLEYDVNGNGLQEFPINESRLIANFMTIDAIERQLIVPSGEECDSYTEDQTTLPSEEFILEDYSVVAMPNDDENDEFVPVVERLYGLLIGNEDQLPTGDAPLGTLLTFSHFDKKLTGIQVHSGIASLLALKNAANKKKSKAIGNPTKVFPQISDFPERFTTYYNTQLKTYNLSLDF